jgi:FkbM family methyltransferase
MQTGKVFSFGNLALIAVVVLATISTVLIYFDTNCSQSTVVAHSNGSSRTLAARSRHTNRYTPRKLTPVVSNQSSKCPPLKSTAIPGFANDRKFSLRENDETAPIGYGLLAASCKPQGWDYTLVLPFYDSRGMDWYTQGFNAIIGKGPAPLCGYNFDPVLLMFKIRPCALIVDIGANMGLSICPYLSRNYRVLAFEPIPKNLNMLRTNVWINGWDTESVGVVSAGVSDHSGQATIFSPVSGEDNSALASESVANMNVHTSKVSKIMIDIISMDDYFDSADSSLIDTVLLFKIDAQGHELQILQGMKKILSSGTRRFALFIEVDSAMQLAAGHDPKDIEKYLLSLDWKPFCSSGNKLQPGNSCYDIIFIHQSRIAEIQTTFP